MTNPRVILRKKTIKIVNKKEAPLYDIAFRSMIELVEKSATLKSKEGGHVRESAIR